MYTLHALATYELHYNLILKKFIYYSHLLIKIILFSLFLNKTYLYDVNDKFSSEQVSSTSQRVKTKTKPKTRVDWKLGTSEL